MLAKRGQKWPISSEDRTWACPPAQTKNILNLCHSCSVMMRANFSHVLRLYIKIDKKKSDLHDLLSEDQNTSLPVPNGAWRLSIPNYLLRASIGISGVYMFVKKPVLALLRKQGIKLYMLEEGTRGKATCMVKLVTSFLVSGSRVE